jgi:protein-disulfide isomerase
VPQLEQLLEKYPTDLRVVFKNFPIPSHKYAFASAMAAMAAGRQGKFWEFHDELFKNYNRLNEQEVEKIVKQLSLDETKFNKDKKNRALINHIQQDYKEGIKIGVRGTPTVFINGKQFRKRRNMKNMQVVIEEELKKEKAKEKKAATQ